MLGIDTNVVVRLLFEDDAEQTRRAQRLVLRAAERGEAVVVSLLVLIETDWVLRSRYDYTKDAVHRALRSLLETRELEFEDESSVEEALFNFLEGPSGFADCLIAEPGFELRIAQLADDKSLRAHPGLPHRSPSRSLPEGALRK